MPAPVTLAFVSPRRSWNVDRIGPGCTIKQMNGFHDLKFEIELSRGLIQGHKDCPSETVNVEFDLNWAQRPAAPCRSWETRSVWAGRHEGSGSVKFHRTRLIDRSVHGRDARLFIIATEGARDEPTYFRGLQERAVIDRSRGQIEAIPTPGDGPSSPEHVLARLRSIVAAHTLAEFDECWLVVDRDRWPVKTLAHVAQECLKAKFGLAVSAPCFEF